MSIIINFIIYSGISLKTETYIEERKGGRSYGYTDGNLAHSWNAGICTAYRRGEKQSGAGD